MQVRKRVIKIVDENEKDYLMSKGWKLMEFLGDDLFKVHRHLSNWELFQARLRELLRDARFNDTLDIDDVHNVKLGYLFVAIGGFDANLLLFDCVAREDDDGRRAVKRRVKQLAKHRDLILMKVKEAFGGRYHKAFFCLVTRDLNVSDDDKKYAQAKGVHLRDSDFFEDCMKVSSTLGETLRPQIFRFLTGEMVPFPHEERSTPLRVLALRKESGNRVSFRFSLTPDTLLKLAYIHRIHRGEREGYQRPLKLPKLRGINQFLFEQKTGFPNDIVVSFDDRDGCRLKWEGITSSDSPGDSIETGWLTIPQYYSVAEVIDGQHRLFGYMNFSSKQAFEYRLSERRKADQLGVIALDDSSGDERARTYIDINTKQTRISVRHIWVLMGRTSPNVLMGYVSNLVKTLNTKGVFKGAIQIPGETAGRARSINIANLGQSLIDLRLLNIEGPDWNLVENRDRLREYPTVPQRLAIEALDRYFRFIRRSYREDWEAKGRGFLCTNNGIHVMLRVLTEILQLNNGKISERILEKTFEPEPGINIIRQYVENNGGGRDLAARVNSAGQRPVIATEIVLEIHKHDSAFGRKYLRERGRLPNQSIASDLSQPPM